MIQRYGWLNRVSYSNFGHIDDGDYVLFRDHEVEIRAAVQREREEIADSISKWFPGWDEGCLSDLEGRIHSRGGSRSVDPIPHFPYGDKPEFTEHLNTIVDAVNELRAKGE